MLVKIKMCLKRLMHLKQKRTFQSELVTGKYLVKIHVHVGYHVPKQVLLIELWTE